MPMEMVEKDGITSIALFWGDLSAAVQEELLKLLGNNGNYDVFPIAEIVYEKEEISCQELS